MALRQIVTVMALALLAGAGLVGYLLYEANIPSAVVSSSEVAKEGGKLFTLKDGRVLEYFDSATPGPVLVAIHGGFQTGEHCAASRSDAEEVRNALRPGPIWMRVCACLCTANGLHGCMVAWQISRGIAWKPSAGLAACMQARIRTDHVHACMHAFAHG